VRYETGSGDISAVALAEAGHLNERGRASVFLVNVSRDVGIANAPIGVSEGFEITSIKAGTARFKVTGGSTATASIELLESLEDLPGITKERLVGAAQRLEEISDAEFGAAEGYVADATMTMPRDYPGLTWDQLEALIESEGHRLDPRLARKGQHVDRWISIIGFIITNVVVIVGLILSVVYK